MRNARVILIYRKPLRGITYRLEPSDESVVGLDRGGYRNIVRRKQSRCSAAISCKYLALSWQWRSLVRLD